MQLFSFYLLAITLSGIQASPTQHIRRGTIKSFFTPKNKASKQTPIVASSSVSAAKIEKPPTNEDFNKFLLNDENHNQGHSLSFSSGVPTPEANKFASGSARMTMETILGKDTWKEFRVSKSKDAKAYWDTDQEVMEKFWKPFATKFANMAEDHAQVILPAKEWLQPDPNSLWVTTIKPILLSLLASKHVKQIDAYSQDTSGTITYMKKVVTSSGLADAPLGKALQPGS
jgi:hypothetical protein